MRLTALAVLVSMVLLPLPASSASWLVDWSGGGDFTNIWGAVGASGEGDTVFVAPGNYVGVQNTGVYFSHNLAIISVSGADATTIDGQLTNGGFTIAESLQDSTTVVRGFTFHLCFKNGSGGALELANGSPLIEDCVFDGCGTMSNGGAVNMASCSATFRNCVFRDCWASMRGGAVYCYNSTGTFSRCLFDENTADVSWRGGAMYMSYTYDTVTHCTFVENEHDALRVYYSPGVTVHNCIFAGTTEGLPVNDDVSDGTEYYYCVTFDNEGGNGLPDVHHDNLSLDPLFCDAENDDYTHCSDSACLPTMNPWTELIGAYDVGCGPCDTPVETSSWGAIKALYR